MVMYALTELAGRWSRRSAQTIAGAVSAVECRPSQPARHRRSPDLARALRAARRRVRLLSWFSLAWMTIEGAIAIIAGIVAGSVALVGFGLDSVIEGVASVIIIWRFTGHRIFSHAAERAPRGWSPSSSSSSPPTSPSRRSRRWRPASTPTRARSGSPSRPRPWSSCRCWGSPRNGSPSSSARRRPRARGARTCSAPTSPAALFVGLLGNALFGAWWLDPRRRPADRRGGRQGGCRGLARRGLLRGGSAGGRRGLDGRLLPRRLLQGLTRRRLARRLLRPRRPRGRTRVGG